jgi:fructose-1,6-bisphosphatase/inositol monophosphatase family enzyme
MNQELVKSILLEIGNAVCDKVHASLQSQSIELLSAIYKENYDDTIYAIDKDVENILVPMLAIHAETLGGIVLVAEGIGEEGVDFVLPTHYTATQATIKIIIDPIDGTRGIMYDKRSAFFLAGAATNNPNNTLQDIQVAVMTELPTSKAMYSDSYWAVKGQGVKGERRNLMTQEKKEKKAMPSQSKTIKGGFAQLSRFFPPGREILAKIEDELIMTLFPHEWEGRTIIFEDQYISSGGQLYEMICGHDRFIGEIRTALYTMLATKGIAAGHACHPYDVCCHLIGTEAGMVITDINGNPLNYPLDTTTSVDWLGFANQAIYNEVFPLLQSLLVKYQLKNS